MFVKTRVMWVFAGPHLRCELVSNEPPSVQIRSLRLPLSLVSLVPGWWFGNLKQSRAGVNIPYFEPSEVDPVDVCLWWTQVVLADGRFTQDLGGADGWHCTRGRLRHILHADQGLLIFAQELIIRHQTMNHFLFFLAALYALITMLHCCSLKFSICQFYI